MSRTEKKPYFCHGNVLKIMVKVAEKLLKFGSFVKGKP